MNVGANSQVRVQAINLKRASDHAGSRMLPRPGAGQAPSGRRNPGSKDAGAPDPGSGMAELRIRARNPSRTAGPLSQPAATPAATPPPSTAPRRTAGAP